MLRRIQPALAKAHKAARNVNQKRSQSLQVLSDNPRLTTDFVVKELDNMFDNNTYTSRYPETSFEDYDQQLNQHLSKPVFYDESMVNLVHKVLGFSKEEAEYGFSATMPELFTPAKDGSYVINWKNITDIYSRTDKESTRIDELEKFYKAVDSAEAAIRAASEDTEEINWADWEKRVGAKTAREAKQHFAEIFDRTKPDFDLTRIEHAFDRQLQPMLDWVKDELVERLPLVKQYTDALVRESPLLKTDEFGMPLVNFDSPHFLDEYYPQERDEIIQEIEDDAWDTQYAAAKKKIRMTPDDLTEYNREWIVVESAKKEEIGSIKVEGGAGLSPQKREEEQIFKDVLEMGRKAKVLEAEVSTLRLQKEFEADENRAKKEATGEKKEEAGDDFFKDSDWDALVNSYSQGETSLRDFKHMTHEQISEWAKKDAEMRSEAESELLRIQKGGKL